MDSVSILYLDRNIIYFITKACLKLVLASSQLGRGDERGGGTRGPGEPGAAATHTNSRLQTTSYCSTGRRGALCCPME